MPRTKVLLADDHAVVAQGLEALLKDTFDLAGVVHDGRALLKAVETLRPDVVVTDISMPLLNGLDALRQIRARWPDVKVVVLTMHRETQLAADAFRAGASGYVLKVSPGEELITAIQQVALGRAYVTTLLAKDLIALLMEASGEARGGTPLTPRQREVLQAIAVDSASIKDTAAKFSMSEGAVRVALHRGLASLTAKLREQ